MIIAAISLVGLMDFPKLTAFPVKVRATSIDENLVETYYGQPGIFNLQEMLNKLGIQIYPEDNISTFPAPVFGIGSQIKIQRAKPITLIDSGNRTEYRTLKITVGDFLSSKNIILANEDKVEPEVDQLIQKNMEIKITRVAFGEITEQEEINYQVISKDDANLEKGQTKILQEGKKGLKEKVFKVKRENGQDVSKELQSTKIIKEAVDRIVSRGTKETLFQSGTATWYDIISGLTCAHPSLPFGSKIKVKNKANGKTVVVTVADRGPFGGAIIDLSKEAFSQIASLGSGRISVELYKE